MFLETLDKQNLIQSPHQVEVDYKSINLTTKKGLQTIFDMFSKTSVKRINDNFSLVGKYVDVTFMDVSWDIFIRDTKSVLQGNYAETLSARKVTNILATLPESIVVHKLSGEAWFKTSNLDWLKDWLFKNRKSIGLRIRGHKPANAYKKRS